MSNAVRIIVAIVAVVVVAASAVLLMGDKSGKDRSDTDNNPGNSNPADTSITAILTYTNDGFDPGSLTVPSGVALRIVNNSDDIVKPSSDPHPEHTINPELNFPEIEPGQSVTRKLNAKGAWGMHDHFNDDHRATITVQ